MVQGVGCIMEDDIPDVTESYADIPENFKEMRCCLRCSLLKAVDQVEKLSCV